MDPTTVELSTINSIQDVMEWLELDEAIGNKVAEAMGADTKLKTWARIPSKRYDTAVEAFMYDNGKTPRQLTPAEEGKVGELCRIVRLIKTNELRHTQKAGLRIDNHVFVSDR